MQPELNDSENSSPSMWRKLIVIISWLLVLIVCVAGLLFIIPRTNMYRFSGSVIDTVHKQ